MSTRVHETKTRSAASHPPPVHAALQRVDVHHAQPWYALGSSAREARRKRLRERAARLARVVPRGKRLDAGQEALPARRLDVGVLQQPPTRGPHHAVAHHAQPVSVVWKMNKINHATCQHESLISKMNNINHATCQRESDPHLLIS